ncbi:Uncharacterized protein HZ326_17182 [Fusarium oxysporum f. sp. albedinis]|nr:Uncharacterized protein HZ326_17182 [Fusarium oxysporum f. sp. albedinis]
MLDAADSTPDMAVNQTGGYVRCTASGVQYHRSQNFSHRRPACELVMPTAADAQQRGNAASPSGSLTQETR